MRKTSRSHDKVITNSFQNHHNPESSENHYGIIIRSSQIHHKTTTTQNHSFEDPTSPFVSIQTNLSTKHHWQSLSKPNHTGWDGARQFWDCRPSVLERLFARKPGKPGRKESREVWKPGSMSPCFSVSFLDCFKTKNKKGPPTLA